MENQRKRGRPKKANAKKLGELNKGLRRYTFVADEKMIEKIKPNPKQDYHRKREKQNLSRKWDE